MVDGGVGGKRRAGDRSAQRVGGDKLSVRRQFACAFLAACDDLLREFAGGATSRSRGGTEYASKACFAHVMHQGVVMKAFLNPVRVGVLSVFAAGSCLATMLPGQQAQPQRQPANQPPAKAAPAASATQPQRPRDAVADAQSPQNVETKRPEQQQTDHDRPERFAAKSATPISPVLKNQAKEGRMTGFDFTRDPLNSDHPMMTLKEIMTNESAARPRVNAAQRSSSKGDTI